MTEATTTHTVDILVGARVRLRRKQMMVSQSQLADICGITFQQIQKYEKGSNRISASKLYEIAQHLKVPISHFFLDMPEPDVEDAPNPNSRALTEAMVDPVVLDTVIALGAMSKAERVFVRNTTLAMRLMHAEVHHNPEPIALDHNAPVEIPPHTISSALSALDGPGKVKSLAEGLLHATVTIWYGSFPTKTALLANIKKVGGTEWTTISDTGKSYIVRKIAEPSHA